ncbi:MAG: hypothetical protein EOM91_11320 [Sphingobacteriia bacterium]|nr:hypothetical protein [Sphingobacteriia bacterium]NCC38188.1 hypothetical protein [Gammaproteobacteria bacterium]
MSQPRTELMDPWRACRRGTHLSGEVSLSRLARLSSAILGLGKRADQSRGDDEGSALYDLRFQLDAEGRAVVHGHVRACLRLTCQCCLGVIEQPVDARIALGLIAQDAQAAQLPDDLDPWLVTARGLDPLELVEEELLLAIPQIPRHPRDSCQAESPGRGADTSEPSPSRHPFAVLGSLRKTRD